MITIQRIATHERGPLLKINTWTFVLLNEIAAVVSQTIPQEDDENLYRMSIYLKSGKIIRIFDEDESQVDSATEQIANML